MTAAKPPLPSTYYRLSVKAVIWRGGKLLLTKEYPPNWTLPGGGLDHGETPEAGLRRELAEELQIEGPVTIAAAPRYVGFGIAHHDDLPFDHAPFCFICYDVEARGQIKPGAHIQDLRWFSPAEAAGAILGDTERATILDIIDHYDH